MNLTRSIILSKIELAMILEACHLSKEHNSVSNRNGYDYFSLHDVKEAAYLYKVWLKYLQLDERYELDTISI